MALFVIPGTVLNPGEAKAADVVQTQVVLVDLDAGDIAAKREHLARYLGDPTLEVASGGVTPEGQRKLHLYWKLTEPAEAEDVAAVCRVRHMIAGKVGGDPAFRSAHQPIRVAGSVHAKSGTKRLVEILELRPFGSVSELFGQKIREGGVDGATRFDALSRIIGYWIRRCQEGHVTAQTAWAEIEAYNEARIDPPWPAERLRQEAERLWKRDQAQNGGGNGGGGGGANGGDPSGGGPGTGPVPPQYSEDALAAEFTKQHAATWRYVAGWGQWLTWTGCVWKREETLGAYHLARMICRATASRVPSAKLRSRLAAASTVSGVSRRASAKAPKRASKSGSWKLKRRMAPI